MLILLPSHYVCIVYFWNMKIVLCSFLLNICKIRKKMVCPSIMSTILSLSLIKSIIKFLPASQNFIWNLYKSWNGFHSYLFHLSVHSKFNKCSFHLKILVYVGIRRTLGATKFYLSKFQEMSIISHSSYQIISFFMITLWIIWDEIVLCVFCPILLLCPLAHALIFKQCNIWVLKYLSNWLILSSTSLFLKMIIAFSLL